MTAKTKRSETRPTTVAEFLRRLPKDGRVTWRDLDPWLDGGDRAFARDIRRLDRGLDQKDIRIESLRPDHPGEAEGYEPPYRQQGSLRRDGVTPYERELERLPRLNRIGEFRMAKRYEFLRFRLDQALAAAGFPEEERRAVILSGRLDGRPWPPRFRRATRKQARLERKLREFVALRDAYIEGALYIVMKAVHRYRNLGIDTLDLIQEGNLSLFQAIEGFDWRRSVRFKTYAEYWVNQAFLKILYNGVRTVRVPVWVQKLLKKIKDLQAASEQEIGRELSVEELGQRLDLPVKKIEGLFKSQRRSISLDQSVGDDGETKIGDLIEDESSVRVEDQVTDVSLEERLREVLQDLSERERLILELRYGLDGKAPRTLFEIGQMLKVSAERVRQIQEAALKRLQASPARERLAPFAV